MGAVGLPSALSYTDLKDTGRGGGVSQKIILDKMSIYIPQGKQAARPVERLMKLGKKRDRSVNYLVVEAILEYLKREEAA